MPHNKNLDQDKSGIIDASLKDEMESSYISYAVSVIVSRAIPDVRDGLKPVHRRILFAMNEMGCTSSGPYKKSARIIGDVIGKYHPHGDVAVYEALVRMAQDFSMGMPLVDGQGNFGSRDDDPAAAMRYTEARLTKLSTSYFNEIYKETVDFRDNYDGSEREPVVLPVLLPNFLINGGEGIAVGMATSTPPHNITEVLDATIAYIQNPNISDEELILIIPGPDFPTGGIILDKTIAARAILTGRGSIPLRGVAKIEEMKNGREMIVITELPYQVIKSAMIVKIAELAKEKIIEGISNIRDESSGDGIRVVIEIKKDNSSEVVLNHLYKLTPLQSSFAVNMVALNNNNPELMNIRTVLNAFLEFRIKVVTKRILFNLNKARERAHTLIGFYIAIDSIDKVISIIRTSDNSDIAKKRLLIEKWDADSTIIKMIDLVQEKANKVEDGKFLFTEAQVKAIIEMRLSRLTGLERDNLSNEINSLAIEIAKYLDILGDQMKIMEIIKNELLEIRSLYPIQRKTQIQEQVEGSVSMEDFIKKEDVVISGTLNGYIKRTKLENYSAQRRGGKGKVGMSTLENDEVSNLFIANTHDIILFITGRGIVFKLKAYQIPETLPNARGRAIINLLPKLQSNDKIETMIPLPYDKQSWDNYDIIFATKKGNIRRSSIFDFENINANGKIAISLDEDDKLIDVKIAKKTDNILLATQNGNAIRFHIDELRVIKSRNSDGVRGINLEKDDCVVSMCVLNDNENKLDLRNQYLKIDVNLRMQIKSSEIGELEIIAAIKDLEKNGDFNLSIEQVKEFAQEEVMLLTVTETGHGKRTSSYEYRITGRGGKGIININIEKTGKVVKTMIAESDQDILLITDNGQVIRIPAQDISIIGRNTKGVKIFNIQEDQKVISVCCI